MGINSNNNLESPGGMTKVLWGYMGCKRLKKAKLLNEQWPLSVLVRNSVFLLSPHFSSPLSALCLTNPTSERQPEERSVTNSSRSCRKCAMLNIGYYTWEKMCVCAVFAVQGVLVAKWKKKKTRIALTAGDLELNTWLHFHSLKKLCWGGQKILLGFWVSFDVSWWRLWNPIKTN